MSMRSREAERRVAALVSLGRVLVFRPLTKAEVEAAGQDVERLEPEDLADAVRLLVEEGLELEALKGAVSRLLNLAARALNRVSFAPSDPFFGSLLLENRAFLAKLDALKPLASRLLAAEGPQRDDLEALHHSVEALKAMDIHYVKKENVLFPYFEARYPRYRCISLMWALHDDMRSSLASLAELSSRPSALPEGREPLRELHGRQESARQALARLLGRLFFDGRALVLREEKLLFPIASSLLEAQEKRALFDESKALGFCLLESGEIASLELSSPSEASSTGVLSPELVELVLRNLPVDITFVDAADRVSYYSSGKDRVFPRSPAIIGRDLRNCHPAKSVDKVLRILEAFRKGEREREEFWLSAKGRFVRIEYRAIRDAKGAYLGTLEITQDLTEARELEGEKRLASF
jgi:uncharacterized protein